MAISIWDIVVQTFANLISNLALFILLYVGFKMIAKEIRDGVKNIPAWIKQYGEIQIKQRAINTAIEGLRKT